MTWRGYSTTQDRILASLTYLLPLLEVLGFGLFLFTLIPPLALLFSPLFPLAAIYNYRIGGMAFIPFVVFFALYLGVVQNQRLNHLLRFNAIQALLLAVFAWLCEAFLSLFGISERLLFGGFGRGINEPSALSAGNWLVPVIFSAIFVLVVGASVYSIVQTLRGKYAEVPWISEAAYSQVR